MIDERLPSGKADILYCLENPFLLILLIPIILTPKIMQTS
jgi:hypothetical protein